MKDRQGTELNAEDAAKIRLRRYGYVVSEQSRTGRQREWDLLVANEDASRVVPVQVKGCGAEAGGWLLRASEPDAPSGSEYHRAIDSWRAKRAPHVLWIFAKEHVDPDTPLDLWVASVDEIVTHLHARRGGTWRHDAGDQQEISGPHE